jgi:acyl-CoA synthetase (AMP-forming)/AMP-acid ligase II
MLAHEIMSSHHSEMSPAAVQITDRSKDVIKSGGEWISSVEIENVAVGHPQVAGAKHAC